MPPFKFTNHHAQESAKIYAQAVIEACEKSKVADVLDAVVNTADYPRLMKISELEYAVGWLHGCAESHGVTVEILWSHLVPATKKRKAA